LAVRDLQRILKQDLNAVGLVTAVFPRSESCSTMRGYSAIQRSAREDTRRSGSRLSSGAPGRWWSGTERVDGSASGRGISFRVPPVTQRIRCARTDHGNLRSGLLQHRQISADSQVRNLAVSYCIESLPRSHEKQSLPNFSPDDILWRAYGGRVATQGCFRLQSAGRIKTRTVARN